MTLTTRAALIARLAAGTAIGALALQAGAAALVASDVGAALRARGVAYDAVRVDGFGRVSVERLTSTFGEGRMSVGRLSFPAGVSGLVASALALDGSAVASDVVIEAPFATYRARRVEASGTAMTGPDLATALDGKSARTIADRFDALSAQSITAPEVIVEQPGPVAADSAGPKIRTVYTDVSFTDVVKGLARAFAATGATFTVEGGGAGGAAQTFGGEVGAIDAARVDLRQIAKAGSTTAPVDEPLAPIYASLSIARSQATFGKTVVATGPIVARDVAARPTGTALADLQTLSRRTDPATAPERLRKMRTILETLLDANAIGGFEVRGVTLRETGKPPKVTLDRLAMNDLVGGRIGAFAVDGLGTDMAGQAFKLGSLTLRGLDLRPALEAIGADPKAVDDKTARKPVPTLASLDLTSLAVDLGGPETKPDSRVAFAIGRIAFESSNPIGGIPTAVRLAVDDLATAIPAKPSDETLATIASLGIERLQVSARLDASYDEGARVLSVNETSFREPQLGSIVVRSAFGDVPRAAFAADFTGMQAAALGARLRSVDLRLSNAGLMERALDLVVKTSGKTREQVRKEWSAAAILGVPAILGDSPQVAKLADAIATFVAAPKTFHATFKAVDGLGLGDIAQVGAPDALMKRLEIVAGAND